MRNVRQIFSLCNGQSFTTSFFLILAAFAHTQHTFAQFTDNFADGNYTANPMWTGIGEKFVVYNQQLRLQAPAATGNAYLATPSRLLNNTSWEFFLNLQFNPSSDNYVRIYLASDQADLTAALNGYFVMVGNTADEISLYRQSGTQRTEIIDGADGIVNVSDVKVRVKVTRNSTGQWQLFSDVGNTGAYISQGSTIENTITGSAYFGVLCVYTSTRADKIYFDDFAVRQETPADTEKPVLTNVNVLSARALGLQFSEPLDATSVAKGVYSVSDGIGPPQSAQLQANHTVRLQFATDFPKNASRTLTVSGLADLAGNIMTPAASSFSYVVTAPVREKDVIITEIFPDPSPQIRLPEGEFAEIYNRSPNAVNLEGWTLADATSVAKFPATLLLPGEYVILTTSANAAAFSAFGKTLALPNFPTLNNSSDVLVLQDSSHATIDSLSYTTAWYHDDDKKEGGWSLELIDPANTCAMPGNWISAQDERGGTPGMQNSVFANKPDVNGPALQSVIPITDTKLRVAFDEKLDRITPLSESFLIDPPVPVQDVRFTDASLSVLELTLQAALARGISYTLFADRIYDCAGNVIQRNHASLTFGLAEPANSMDVVINEILFNPRPTGADFVEICNRSAKYLNLKGWMLARDTDLAAEGKVIAANDLLLPPGGYLLLSEDGQVVKNEYPLAHEKNFLDIKDLPSMNDDEGNIALLDSTSRPIDALTYADNWHAPFIDDDEGVSLERLSWLQPTQIAENWHSAGTQAGYATPGYKNSNAIAEYQAGQAVVVEPEAFMPELGQPAFARIGYRFDQGGFVANVNIIDPQGRMIKTIATNDMLGTSGFYRWDGDMDNGNKARVGYYMVWFEVFDGEGNVQLFKRRVAVVGDF